MDLSGKHRRRLVFTICARERSNNGIKGPRARPQRKRVSVEQRPKYLSIDVIMDFLFNVSHPDVEGHHQALYSGYSSIDIVQENALLGFLELG